MAIYRGDYYQKDETLYTGDAEIIVLKSRESATGTAKMKWKGETMTFYEEDMHETREEIPFEV